MNNFGTPTDPAEQYFVSYTNSQEVKVQLPNLTNKYVFVKQNFLNSNPVDSQSVPKVLVNPNFTKKVFVNPNFNINRSVPTSTAMPKIHVNPKVQKLNLNAPTKCSNIKKIHVNPNVLRNVPVSLSNENKINYTGDVGAYHQYKGDISPIRHTIVSTRTKLIRSPLKCAATQTRKRRSSVCSKFKIIRASIYNNSIGNENKNRLSLRTKYKIIKSTCSTYAKNCSTSLSQKPSISKFKLDNRRNSKTLKSSVRNKRYVYVNRFLSISDIARNNLLKQGTKSKKNIINISGVQFKRSPNCLRRTLDSNKKPKTNNTRVITPSQSKYKFVRKSLINKINSNDGEHVMKHSKGLRIPKAKKNVSPGKLRKCNIPCPYYRKFGRCKGRENGKCYRKHDPDQIALCTKFLQGACVDKNCLLSHNVSPEKMPTCKFYLEGSCSRDDCPYLHVRISPKADICKDFLEGFCRKAAECDKRHQFLCPDFEKHGKCQKQRCPYPHGKMVRKYSVFSKNKFAKKSSDKECNNDAECYSESKNKDILLSKDVGVSSEPIKSKVNYEVNIKTRYYIEHNLNDEEKCAEVSCSDHENSEKVSNCDQENCIRSRPKLGKLPSFIAFEDI